MMRLVMPASSHLPRPITSVSAPVPLNTPLQHPCLSHTQSCQPPSKPITSRPQTTHAQTQMHIDSYGHDCVTILAQLASPPTPHPPHTPLFHNATNQPTVYRQGHGACDRHFNAPLPRPQACNQDCLPRQCAVANNWGAVHTQ